MTKEYYHPKSIWDDEILTPYIGRPRVEVSRGHSRSFSALIASRGKKFTFFLGYRERSAIQCAAARQFAEQSELLSILARIHTLASARAREQSGVAGANNGGRGSADKDDPTRRRVAVLHYLSLSLVLPRVGAFQMRADFITRRALPLLV